MNQSSTDSTPDSMPGVSLHGKIALERHFVHQAQAGGSAAHRHAIGSDQTWTERARSLRAQTIPSVGKAIEPSLGQDFAALAQNPHAVKKDLR